MAEPRNDSTDLHATRMPADRARAPFVSPRVSELGKLTTLTLISGSL